MKPLHRILVYIYYLKRKYLNNRQFMMALSVVIGFLSGLAAVIIKNAVHLIKYLLVAGLNVKSNQFLYFFYPIIGIIITVLFIKFILRQYVGDGVPSVLYAISKTKGILKKHNMFSSVVSSSFTVGFGGSVGLEGPALTSYFFLGMDVLYPLEITEKFKMQDIGLYILLGVATGLASLYFTKIYMYFQTFFSGIKKWYARLLIGGSLLGILIYFFPSLYGEGYEATNSCLHGSTITLFNDTLFYSFKDNISMVFVLLVVIILMKVIATSLTFGAGGIGGIFAPTLFTGAHVGLLFAIFVNYIGYGPISTTNFALVGMAGLIAGVIHAPLTAIFLIAEISQGYELFMPLMITAVVSFITIRFFEPNSVYTIQLAKRGELMTHHHDKNVLAMLDFRKLVETNFNTVHVEASLGNLVEVIENSNRNIFPVVDDDGIFHGHVILDNVRHKMFKPEIYNTTTVGDLMITPKFTVTHKDTIEEIAQKFKESGKYNLPVIENGKYMGYISKANLFGAYRDKLREVSEH
ncbi:MAG: hypothetical protein B6I19_08400 [Bacteroidetes bacterium 4572_114]|nr:MAG: hypothetical protein B6I19_08400 [Bacteroidetes bacterium 4572_114]